MSPYDIEIAQSRYQKLCGLCVSNERSEWAVKEGDANNNMLDAIRTGSRGTNPIKNCAGFTLVEALLSVVILGLMVTGISAMYLSGFQSLNTQDDRMLLDSRLRSRMEVLVGTDFAALSAGSEVVAVNGQNYTIDWNVVSIDLDGDATPESNAKQVTVSAVGVPGRSLTTIIVDHEGRVSKI
jgi:Tfp pilus assembly protein PilV